MDYLYHLATFIAIYTILAQGLNLFSGYTGLLSLAHAGFYGIGAYTAALLAVNFGFSIFLNFLIAGIFCGVIALLISVIALRTYEDYFVIVTLGIQVIAFSFMNNWAGLTNGPLGITNIPGVGWLPDKLAFMAFAVTVAGMVYLLLWRLSRASWVLNLRGIRDDEVLMQAMGKPVRQIKAVTFTLSAVTASMAGVLYAHYMSYIDPTSFTIHESIYILAIVIIGGLGNLHGAFFAAAFMVLLPEVLRFVGLPDAIGANARQMIYGALLVGVILWTYREDKASEE
uniref:Amino acid/amide ABC transporter membrane protein 2, HAAT family n=1 Tax=Candidatus Kentrum sp. DK TaxID=2126562 RepID=A0A450TJD3_9GAMM|nr:MAG: amino acid/amide ABC transporter membrane protein 2, HAAT family [Candidatus Kentron sp. DK]